MSRYICKFEDHGKSYYLEWSTIVDAPVTNGMSLDEFKAYYAGRYDTVGTRGLDERLERVEAKGTSSQIHDSLDQLIAHNRAGPKEENISKQQIIKLYCTDPNTEE